MLLSPGVATSVSTVFCCLSTILSLWTLDSQSSSSCSTAITFGEVTLELNSSHTDTQPSTTSVFVKTLIGKMYCSQKSRSKRQLGKHWSVPTFQQIQLFCLYRNDSVTAHHEGLGNRVTGNLAQI